MFRRSYWLVGKKLGQGSGPKTGRGKGYGQETEGGGSKTVVEAVGQSSGPRIEVTKRGKVAAI